MKTKTTLLGGAGLLLSAGLLAAPAKPNIAWMPLQVDNGQNTLVHWDMWWGTNGTH